MSGPHMTEPIKDIEDEPIDLRKYAANLEISLKKEQEENRRLREYIIKHKPCNQCEHDAYCDGTVHGEPCGCLKEWEKIKVPTNNNANKSE